LKIPPELPWPTPLRISKNFKIRCSSAAMSSRKKSKSLGKGSAAAAKDASWEFSAPKFHDFTKIESEEDANAEQQWFGAFPHFACCVPHV
jgi:hypothetical protein